MASKNKLALKNKINHHTVGDQIVVDKHDLDVEIPNNEKADHFVIIWPLVDQGGVHIPLASIFTDRWDRFPQQGLTYTAAIAGNHTLIAFVFGTQTKDVHLYTQGVHVVS